MKQKVIVIGATGLVGRALVAQLAQNDGVERIVTLTRRAVEYNSPKVENHVLDFAQLARHAELFRGDVLFSCLGTTRQQAGSIAAQRVVDVDYQFAAAQLAAQQGVRHYVLVSSSGADASSRNAYLQMKGELEQKVSALPFARISIVQPSLLLGERTERRVGEQLGAWLLPLICQLPGLRRFRPIRGEEVAAKMIRISQSPSKQGANSDHHAGQNVERFRLDELFD